VNLPILSRIDDAIRAHDRAALPEPAPCHCSWCQRQGMTRMMPTIPAPLPLPRAARPAPWWRPRRR